MKTMNSLKLQHIMYLNIYEEWGFKYMTKLSLMEPVVTINIMKSTI
jgi:hypothetical protein